MKILSHTLYTPTSIYRMEKCGIHAAQFLFFSADGKPANFICLKTDIKYIVVRINPRILHLIRIVPHSSCLYSDKH